MVLGIYLDRHVRTTVVSAIVITVRIVGVVGAASWFASHPVQMD
jgi:hypothetical protein